MRELILQIAKENLQRVHARDRYVGSACPFHKGGRERKPSFYISLDEGYWKCSSCGEGGPDIKSLLARLGVRGPVIDAQIEIAQREVRQNRVLNEAKRKAKARVSFEGVYTLPDSLLGVYDWVPLALVRKGFKKEVLRAHEIGYDRERNRITFPIRDIKGSLVGVYGRQPEGMTPKYIAYSGRHTLNGREVPGELGEAFPDYSCEGIKDHLWRGHLVFDRLYSGKEKQQIVVEGFKAGLWLVQLDWQNTVGTEGTEFTEQQVRLLRRTGADTWVFFDNDPAGRRASKKLCRLLAKSNSARTFEVSYPEDREYAQPDDLTEEEVERCLSNAERIG